MEKNISKVRAHERYLKLQNLGTYLALSIYSHCFTKTFSNVYICIMDTDIIKLIAITVFAVIIYFARQYDKKNE